MKEILTIAHRRTAEMESSMANNLATLMQQGTRSIANSSLFLVIFCVAWPLQMASLQASANPINKNVWRSLRYAAKEGRLDSLNALLKTATEEEINEPDPATGNTLLHVAASAGHADIINALLNSGLGNNNPGTTTTTNTPNELGQTPLHLAVLNNNTAAINTLLTNKALITKDKLGQTPLHLAALNNNTAAIKTLLEREAWIDAENLEGQTPLQVAIRKGNFEAAKVLLEAITPEMRSIKPVLPLHYAIEANNIEMLKKLLAMANSKEYLNDKSEGIAYKEEDETPLHYAIRLKNIDAVKLLLQQEEIDVNAQNSYGSRTPLHYAVYYGNSEILELLLKQKNINPELKAFGGRTPLNWAATGDRWWAVELLLKHGADRRNIYATKDTSEDTSDYLGHKPHSLDPTYYELLAIQLLAAKVATSGYLARAWATIASYAPRFFWKK